MKNRTIVAFFVVMMLIFNPLMMAVAEDANAMGNKPVATQEDAAKVAAEKVRVVKEAADKKAAEEKVAAEEKAKQEAIEKEAAEEMSRVVKLATASLGKGIETPIIDQLYYDPSIAKDWVIKKANGKEESLAYTGDMDDDKARLEWAQKTAHKLAEYFGFTGKKARPELRLKKAAVGKIAFVLATKENDSSKPQVMITYVGEDKDDDDNNLAFEDATRTTVDEYKLIKYQDLSTDSIDVVFWYTFTVAKKAKP